jgi:hypothetical protein
MTKRCLTSFSSNDQRLPCEADGQSHHGDASIDRGSCSSNCAKPILTYSNAASHGDLRVSRVAFQGLLRLLMYAVTWEDGEERIPIMAGATEPWRGKWAKYSADTCGFYPAFQDSRATKGLPNSHSSGERPRFNLQPSQYPKSWESSAESSDSS